MNINTSLGLIQNFYKTVEKIGNKSIEATDESKKLAAIVNECVTSQTLSPENKKNLIECLTNISNFGDKICNNTFVARDIHNKALKVLQIAKSIHETPPQASQTLKLTSHSPPISKHSSGKSPAKVVKDLPAAEVREQQQSKRHSIKRPKAEVGDKPVEQSEKLSSQSPKGKMASRSKTISAVRERAIKSAAAKETSSRAEAKKNLIINLSDLADSRALKRYDLASYELISMLSGEMGQEITAANIEQLANALNHIEEKITPSKEMRSVARLLLDIQEARANLQKIDIAPKKAASKSKSASKDKSRSKTKQIKPKKTEYKEAILSKNASRLTIRKVKKTGALFEKELHRRETLGSGGGGEVVSYKSQSEGTKKAVKFFHDSDSDSNETELKALYINPVTGTEVKSLPGIQPQPKIATQHEEKSVKVYTLFEKDITHLDKEISYDELMKGVADLAFGLAHMHRDMGEAKPAFVHRDMKPENILFGVSKGQLQFCICDLDSAHRADGQLHLNVLDSPKYLSEDEKEIKRLLSIKSDDPVIKKTKQNIDNFYRSLDVRNMGLAFITLIAGRGPKSIDEEITLDDVAPTIRMGANADEVKLQKLCELISKMTEPWWEDRPTMDQVLQKMQEIGIEIPDYQHIS